VVSGANGTFSVTSMRLPPLYTNEKEGFRWLHYVGTAVGVALESAVDRNF
jgi:hypothetical protein